MHGSNFLPYVALFLLLGPTLACAPHAGHARIRHPMLTDHSGRPPLEPGPADVFQRQGPEPEEGASADGARQQVALKAGSYVGQREVVVGEQHFRADCSGTVRGIYAAAGIPLGGQAADAEENDVSIIHRWVSQVGSLRRTEPRVGDLVFFDNTYDRNGDGRANDELSHIGVVEKILDDGTIVFVHRVGGGILRYRMNLEHPEVSRDPRTGRRLNHVLRREQGDIEAATTGELFVGFGTVILYDDTTTLAQR